LRVVGGSARARVRGGAAAPSLLVATGNVGGQLRMAFSKVSYIYDYLYAERERERERRGNAHKFLA
jgi:hypothetical protein